MWGVLGWENKMDVVSLLDDRLLDDRLLDDQFLTVYPGGIAEPQEIDAPGQIFLNVEAPGCGIFFPDQLAFEIIELCICPFTGFDEEVSGAWIGPNQKIA